MFSGEISGRFEHEWTICEKDFFCDKRKKRGGAFEGGKMRILFVENFILDKGRG